MGALEPLGSALRVVEPVGGQCGVPGAGRQRTTTNYTWTVKGKPVPPRYQWTTGGLNFIGFPTPAAAAPTFEDFLAPAPELRLSGEFYAYPGGNLGATNPARVFAYRNARVNRGQAFWVRSGTTYNRYYGPFEVVLSDAQGVQFGSSSGQQGVRLRNLTASSLTVTLNLLDSETPPTGQSAILGAPPLLIRGELNMTNLTYSHTNLTGPRSWVLQPAGQGWLGGGSGAGLEPIANDR